MFKTRNPSITFLFELIDSYSREEIKALFGNVYETFLERGFLSVSNSRVIFTYVGFVCNGKNIVCILPKHVKYQLPKGIGQQESFHLAKGKQLIDVLKAYEDFATLDLPSLEFYNDSFTSQTNEITVADFLINDYIEFGLWFYKSELISINSEGDVMWETTIDNIPPVILNKVPLYFDTYNRTELASFNSLLTQIHSCAITYCDSRYSRLLGFETDAESLPKLAFNDLGEPEFLVNILERELRVTYREREVNLLKSLIALIMITDSSIETPYSLYGKNKFENIWEHALSYNFSNEFENYKDLIPHPIWTDGQISISRSAFRPDVLRVFDKSCLLIIDAKYYLVDYSIFTSSQLSTPGVGDIVKQYFYEIGLVRSKLSAPWIPGSKPNCINILAFPSLQNSNSLFSILGNVTIDNDYIKNPIVTLSLNPDKIFSNYVLKRRLTDKEVDNLVRECASYLLTKDLSP